MAELKICQWNCRSAISNKENLLNLLSETNADIALLSETWFRPGVFVSFPLYSILPSDRLDGRGGVAILLKKILNLEKYVHLFFLIYQINV